MDVYIDTDLYISNNQIKSLQDWHDVTAFFFCFVYGLFCKRLQEFRICSDDVCCRTFMTRMELLYIVYFNHKEIFLNLFIFYNYSLHDCNILSSTPSITYNSNKTPSRCSKLLLLSFLRFKCTLDIVWKKHPYSFISNFLNSALPINSSPPKSFQIIIQQ